MSVTQGAAASAKKPVVIAVCGATASGKTALGVEIAKAHGGEVISADSMQIYQGLDIATAKPTADEMQGIPHHLISLLPPEQACSVAEYVELARERIADLLARDRLPVIVGGTGLYLDALLDNIQFPDIPADDALRARLHAEAAQCGNAEMLRRLMQCDPETAARLHENNLRRIIRALEVYALTGIPLSEHARRSRSVPPPWHVIRIGLGWHDREKQYARIRARVDEMVHLGLAQEVRAEYDSGRRRATAAMAIGYKELLPWLRGEADFDSCIAVIKQETCRYAKRQGTWFRRNAGINWIYRDDDCADCGILERCENFLAKAADL